MTNSNQKGKRGEREWARELREVHGCSEARRGQQFKGGPDSPDVLGMRGVHWEVKRTEALSLYRAMAQAANDCGDDVPAVAHRKNGQEWLVVIRSSDLRRFCEAYMGEQIVIEPTPTTR